MGWVAGDDDGMNNAPSSSSFYGIERVVGGRRCRGIVLVEESIAVYLYWMEFPRF